jgi:fructose-specific phosphotransferase system IIC component
VVTAGFVGTLIGATIFGWSDVATALVCGYAMAYLAHVLELRRSRWTPGKW